MRARSPPDPPNSPLFPAHRAKSRPLPPPDADKTARRAKRHARARARLDARAFKELDSALAALGIEPGVGAGAAPPADGPPRAADGRPRSTRRLGFETPPESDAGARADAPRARARPPPPQPQPQSAPPPLLQQTPNASASASSVSAERLAWHASLSHLLDGDFAREDWELALSLARSKAGDLVDQLALWRGPPDPCWPAREQRLDWLEAALGEARDIATGLRQHGALTPGAAGAGPCGPGAYVGVVRGVAASLAETAVAACDAVADGLRALVPGDADTRRALRAAARAVGVVAGLAARLRGLAALEAGGPPGDVGAPPPLSAAELNELTTTTVATESGAAPTPPDLSDAVADLGCACARVALAALDAASDAGAALLTPASLAPSAAGHELAVLARTLAALWLGAGDLVEAVAAAWPEQRPELVRDWLLVFLAAARGAASAQRAATAGGEPVSAPPSDADEPGSGAATPRSAWGVGHQGGGWAGGGGGWPAEAPGTADPPPAAIHDDELQAQAWLPSCLTALLAAAEHAAAVALEGAGASAAVTPRGEGEAPPPPPPPPPPSAALTERLSDAMYDLAFASARRVAALCASPSGLACWALELLEEQACAAVVFVRDLDVSLLGRGPGGLRHYASLRRAADALVNAILRVRRLLKAKRDAADRECGGRRLPAAPSALLGMPPRPATPAAGGSGGGGGPARAGAAGAGRGSAAAAAATPAPPPPVPPAPPSRTTLSPFEAAQGLPIDGWDDAGAPAALVPPALPRGASPPPPPRGRHWAWTERLLGRRRPESASDSRSRSRARSGRGSRGASPADEPDLPWGREDPFWQVDWAELRPTLVKKLGSGSFSSVYQGEGGGTRGRGSAAAARARARAHPHPLRSLFPAFRHGRQNPGPRHRRVARPRVAGAVQRGGRPPAPALAPPVHRALPGRVLPRAQAPGGRRRLLRLRVGRHAGHRHGAVPVWHPVQMFGVRAPRRGAPALGPLRRRPAPHPGRGPPAGLARVAPARVVDDEVGAWAARRGRAGLDALAARRPQRPHLVQRPHHRPV
jgi:hypothetical protein